ncbi:MAG TPA: CYTH domain-containing protein [Polyangiaceae bacterium]|jgi:uncharacterized protein YjbK
MTTRDLTTPDGNLEVELKFRLADAAAQSALIRALGGTGGPSVEQRNHFFDTAERDLGRAKYTLRLREERGRGYLLTAKGPERRSFDGMLTEKLEREGPLDARTAQSLLDGYAAPLAVLSELLGANADVCVALREAAGERVVSEVGSFANTRTPLAVEVDVRGVHWPAVFEFDRTVFPDGRVDFEVEVELRGLRTDEQRDQLAEAVRNLVRQAGIELEPAPSKAQRLFEILAKR